MLEKVFRSILLHLSYKDFWSGDRVMSLKNNPLATAYNTYIDTTLLREVHIDEEVRYRITVASVSFGRLHDTVW